MSTSRFGEALSAETGTRVENQPLVRGVHSVVVPTVGMIVPNWFLIVPRARTMNFAQQQAASRQEIQRIVENLSGGFTAGEYEVVILEHGPAGLGSPVGCGVDHAHLHVLFLQTAFANALWSRIAADLSAQRQSVPMSGLHEGVDEASAYYLAWRNGDRLLEQPVKAETSQRFRKLIACEAGVAEQWDYRVHPFVDNVGITVASQRRHMLTA